MAHPKRYTVTAALPYANGPVHIGHLAGCYLPADIYVRYLRQQKRDVKFICGSDEHGVAITLKARAEGISPQEVVDRYHGIMREAFAEFGISFDIYSRTSDPEHHQTASDFFLKMHEQGSFEQVESQQYYDPEAEQFLADRYIEGTCPNCGHESAYGDQCENCGSSLSPTDLKNPKSRLSGAAPILKNTTHWYLPLNHLSEKIEKYIAAHSDWKPNVYGQCMSWLKAADGLQSRAMTRDLDWGVKVPLAEAEGKVLYVWFDAPIGYISATKKLLGADWEPYWKDKDTKLVHFIGKDNIVFHCIIFPAMLMEHGEYMLPEDVPANEFLNLEGKKISTSRNWAVWLHEYLQDFSGKQDALRYSLCANAPETKDNDFTWKDFQARNNNELVAVYGNFINRVFVLMDKYYGGIVPALGEVTKAEEELFAEMKGMPEKIAQAIEKYRFREALQHLMNLARSGNKYLADQEPWKVVKQDEARAASILNAALQCAALLSQLSEPFLPFSAQALRTAMGLELSQWSSLDVSALVAGGTQLNKLGLLFEKVEDSAIEAQLQKLEQSRVSNSPSYAPLKPNASFADFEKMDLRTGVILEAAPVPKTDKLMQLKVDLGFEQRTIVSGIAHQFKGEELIGKSVVVLANLEPRKIRGVLSNGMILMSEDAEGQLHLMAADGGKAGEVVR